MSQPDNRRFYTALLAYPNSESIPYEELAKNLKTSPAKLQGLTGALTRGAPKALLELQEAGYTMEELPPWVGSKPRKSQKKPPLQEPEAKEKPLPEPRLSPEEAARRLAGELQARRQAEHATTLPTEEEVIANGALGLAPGLGRGLDRGLGGGSNTPSSLAMGEALQLMSQKEGGSYGASRQLETRLRTLLLCSSMAPSQLSQCF